MRRREFVALTVVQQRRGHLQQLELRCDIICLSSGDAACSSSPIMRPLSSKMTFYYKRVSPVSFFGVVLLMFGFGLISVLRDRQVSNVPFLIVLLLLAVFAYRFMKKLVFNLADEVLDAGNALVVRSGGQEERIALSDIKNVNYSPYMSPPQVTLSVRRHTAFGETIAFLAPVSIFPLRSSAVINDLIDRVDAARQK